MVFTDSLGDALTALKKATDDSDWNTEADEELLRRDTRKDRSKRVLNSDATWEPPKKVDKRMTAKGTNVRKLARPPTITLKRPENSR